MAMKINTATKRAGSGRNYKARLASTASIAMIAGLAASSSAWAQVYDNNDVFEADHADAIGGTMHFRGNSTLNATVANAVSGGILLLRDNARLNATAANAIVGGQQVFGDNAVLDATVADAISGGQLALRANAVGNLRASHASNGGDLQLTLHAVLNVWAEDAITQNTRLQFATQSFVDPNSVGGYLRLNGYSTAVGGITSSDGGAGIIENTGADASMLSVNNSALTSEFSGVIRDGGAGTLGLTLLDGELRLSGANTYTGGTVVEGGLLQARSAGAFVASTAYVVNDGTLDLGGFPLTMSSLSGTGGAVAIGATTLTVDQATNTSFAGVFTGTGGLVKAGTGTLSLSGDSSSFTGWTDVRNGALTLAGALGGDKTVRSGGVLNAVAENALGQNEVQLLGTGTLNVGADNALAGAEVLFANPSLPGGPSGLLALNGYDSAVRRIDSLSAFAGVITNGGAADSMLTIQGAGTFGFTGVMEDGAGGGSLGLTMESGTLILGGGDANSYTGGTTVNGGVLRANSAGGFVSGTAYAVNGGALELNGFDLTMSSLSGGGGAVALGTANLTVNQAADSSFAGVFTGAGGFTKSGPGVLTLGGNSSAFTGATKLLGGTLVLGGVLGGDKSLYNDSVLDAAVAGALGSGSHTWHDDSRLRASVKGAAGSSYLTLKDKAILDVLANNALTSTAHLSFDSAAGGVGGMLRLNGYSTTVGHLRTINPGAGVVTNGGATDSVLTVDNSIGLTFFSGLIQDGSGGGRLGLTLAAGNLTLSGSSNSYTGGTTVNGGVLRASTAGAFVASTDYAVNGGVLYLGGFPLAMKSLSGTGGTVAVGATTLTVDQATDTTFAGVFSGTGRLAKAGAGTLTLTGNSSAFAGAAMVSGGRLRIDGVLGGDVAARTAGILTGTGRIAGDVDLTGGGALLGEAGQTLRIDRAAVMDGASVLSVALGAPSGVALFEVGGDLTLDGRLNVTDAGGFGTGVYRLFDYGGSLIDGGLEIGATPAGINAADLAVQTSVAGQVNLVSTAGAELGFWDGGDEASHDNGVVDGGSGVWSAGGKNWTRSDGGLNGRFKPNPTYAVFQGDSGVVMVDRSEGVIGVTGMQFATDGYSVQDGEIALQGAGGEAIIRVGDGSSAGAGMTAALASTLSGDSMLIKSDLGRLTLQGVNTYTGGTRIDAGTLAVGVDANLGDAAGDVTLNGGVLSAYESFVTSRSIVMNAAGRFEVAAGKTLGLDGVISGAGDLVKQGEGTLVLTGANAYGGDTVVAAGTLVGDAASLRGDMRNAGVVSFDQGVNAVFGGAIGGLDGNDGVMIKRGAGDLSVTGVSSLDWTIEAGSLITAANRFSGDAAIGSGGGLTFDQKGDGAYGGTLSGSGAFRLAGTATVTLNGDSSAFSGTTSISDGARLVVGTSSGGALGGSMTVGSGGLLGGSGRIGSAGAVLTIAPGAVHAPGNSIGVQTIVGDYVNRGLLQVEATPTGADQIVVAGSVDITGAALDLVLSPTDASSWNVFNGPFKIIDKQSAGAVIGRFEPITRNLIFLDPILDYAGGDGNDVTLELVRNDVSFAEVGVTRNQIAAGEAVDALGNANPLWRSIALSNDRAVIRAGFDALSGEIHASTKTALVEDSRFLRSAVNDRLRAAAERAEDRAAVWGQGFGAWGHVDSDGNAARLSRATTGFAFGADVSMFKAWRVGAVAGYERMDFKVKDRASSGAADTYQAALYGGSSWGGFALRAGLAYAWHEVSTTRMVAMPGVRETLSSSLGAEAGQAFGEVGYAVRARGVAFEPFANLARVSQRSDSFTETGGAAALRGHGGRTETTFTTLGLRAAMMRTLNGAGVTAKGMLGWRHAFGGTAPDAAMRFGDGEVFTIRGVPVAAQDAAVLEAGLEYAISPESGFSVAYSGQLGSGMSDQSFKASFNVRF